MQGLGVGLKFFQEQVALLDLARRLLAALTQVFQANLGGRVEPLDYLFQARPKGVRAGLANSDDLTPLETGLGFRQAVQVGQGLVNGSVGRRGNEQALPLVQQFGHDMAQSSCLAGPGRPPNKGQAAVAA